HEIFLENFIVIYSVLTVTEIGKVIRTERKRQKIIQQDLAALSGVSHHFLSNLENGKASVEFQKVLLIFRSLGIEMQLTTRQAARNSS
ncbi:MAG: helix-turn-helix transcriptional regulator, partial [Spirochaetaceae bacterium]|nr:helix-turn-helix transcriptional regulator [Spirochaetaceae bacterium]